MNNRKEYLLYPVALLMIILAIFGGYFAMYNQIVSEIETKTLEHIRLQNEYLQNAIELKGKSNIAKFEIIASRFSNIDEMDIDEIRESIGVAQQVFPSVSKLSVITADGRVHENKSSRTTIMANSDIGAVFKGENRIYFERNSDKTYVRYLVPVSDGISIRAVIDVLADDASDYTDILSKCIPGVVFSGIFDSMGNLMPVLFIEEPIESEYLPQESFFDILNSNANQFQNNKEISFGGKNGNRFKALTQEYEMGFKVVSVADKILVAKIKMLFIKRILLTFSLVMVAVFSILAFCIILCLIEKNKVRGAVFGNSITGLATRWSIRKYYESLKDNAKGYSCVFLRIDNYEETVKLFGLKMAEDLVMRISHYIKKALKKGEIASRINGNSEFVLLLKGSADSVSERVAKVASYVSAIKLSTGAMELEYTYDIVEGIYNINGEENGFENIMGIVKTSCDKKYIDGKENELLDNSKTVFSNFGSDILNDFKKALEERRITTYFKTRHDITNNDVVGAVLDFKWQHPKYGLLNSSHFLDILIESGNFQEFVFYMFEEACIMINQWTKNEMVPVPIEVKCSLYNLYCKEFLKKLNSLIKKYEVPTCLIEIGFKLDGISMESDVVKKSIKALKKSGFHINIFGSKIEKFDYSLLKIPFDNIKIDGDFLNDDEKTLLFKDQFKVLLDFCEKNNIRLIVDNLETQEQALIIYNNGGKYAEGNLFSKELHKEKFEKAMFDD